MDDDIQIAGRSPMPPRVPFHDLKPCSVDRSRGNHDGNAFGPHHPSVGPAYAAALVTLTAGAATGRARLREHHVAARPPDTARRMTVRTSSFGALLPLPRQD